MYYPPTNLLQKSDRRKGTMALVKLYTTYTNKPNNCIFNHVSPGHCNEMNTVLGHDSVM